jgi:hypothetical protein
MRMFERTESEDQRAEDSPVIEYICKRLADGELSRRDIAQDDLGNKMSRKMREKVLDRYTDGNEIIARRYWSVTKGETGGQIYSLMVRAEDCF